MLNLIKGEFLKLKRSSVFRISLLGSCIIPLLILMVLIKFALIDNVSTWDFAELFGQNITYLCMFFGLLLNMLIVSYIFYREYKEHTIKAILTTQVTKSEYFISKIIVYIIWSLMLTLISLILVLLIGLVFHAPGLSAKLLVQSFIGVMMADFMLSLVALVAVFITLLFKSIIPPIIIGMGISLGSMMVLNDNFSIYYPTTGILYLFTQEKELIPTGFSPSITVAIVGLIAIVSILVSWIYFKKTSVPL